MKKSAEPGDRRPSGCMTALIRLLLILLLLVTAATGAIAVYAFKTDTVQILQADKVSATAVELSVSSLKHSALEVQCSQGNQAVACVAAEDGKASFSGLEPDTEYTFTVKSASGRYLKGSTAQRITTDSVVTLKEFCVSDCTAVSAAFSLYGTGRLPDSWRITLTSSDGETISREVTGTEFTIDGLTPETGYTAELACGDDAPLAGVTECSMTTAAYTTLESFACTARSADSMTFAWEFTGTEPDSWTVTCSDEAGHESQQIVENTTCSFSGMTIGTVYTITLQCASLKETELSVLQEEIPEITVTDVSCEPDGAGNYILTWDYEAELQPESWTITCACASAGELQTIETEETEVTLSGLIPDADYQISMTAADGLPVTGEEASIAFTTASAAAFTDYGCTDLTLTLYVREDNPDTLTDAVNAFQVGQHLAYRLEVQYETGEEEKTVQTLYVVRDADGIPVMAYRGERTWNGSWPVLLHEGDLPDPLETAGSYTFEIYFDGALAAQAGFSVSDS